MCVCACVLAAGFLFSECVRAPGVIVSAEDTLLRERAFNFESFA